MLFMIDNIHNERGTYYTDSTLPGYYIMSVVCILYRYQDSALNHMTVLILSNDMITKLFRKLQFPCKNLRQLLTSSIATSRGQYLIY